ncbi:MAG: EamA family transporter [Spirochaetia bacterium]|nr:EamA family transporter [Spirochaetia bacterium]
MKYSYVILTILCTVYGQLMLKWRISLNKHFPESAKDKIIFLIQNLQDIWILTAFFAAFVAALSWMAAMTKMQLSDAYPFLSITFPVVVILSGFFFNEPLSVYKYLGLIIIVAGVIVISRG